MAEAARAELPSDRAERYAALRREIAAVIAGEPNRTARYATAADLSSEVGRLLDAEPVSAYRESFVEKAGRWAGKNRFLILLVLAYLVMRIFLIFTSRS